MSTDSTALSGGIILSALFFSLFAYVISAYLMSVVFRKMNIETWKAWVPLYNSWVLLEAGAYPGALILLAFIPGVNIVIVVLMVIAVHRINRGFGHDAGMTVLYVFLPFIWYLVIGFGSSVWRGLPDGLRAKPSAEGANAVLQGGYGQPGYPQQGYGQPGF